MPTETEPAARAAGQAAAEALPPTFQDVIMSLQRYWAGAGCVILEMTSSTASLEDVFMELTAGDPEDPEEKEGEEE